MTYTGFCSKSFLLVSVKSEQRSIGGCWVEVDVESSPRLEVVVVGWGLASPLRTRKSKMNLCRMREEQWPVCAEAALRFSPANEHRSGS